GRPSVTVVDRHVIATAGPQLAGPRAFPARKHAQPGAPRTVEPAQPWLARDLATCAAATAATAGAAAAGPVPSCPGSVRTLVGAVHGGRCGAAGQRRHPRLRPVRS